MAIKSRGHQSGVNCHIRFGKRVRETYVQALVDHLSLVMGVRSVTATPDLHKGSQWVQRVRATIAKADVLICILGSGEVLSPWILAEIAHFRNTGRKIVTISPESQTRLPASFEVTYWIRENDDALTHSPSKIVLQALESLFKHVNFKGIRGARLKAAPLKSPPKKRPLNEGKLILVGRGEVGKTSLIKRLVKNTFDGDESKTQGINITNWSLPCGKDILRLNVWDFGGQEIMHATHQFFLTKQSLYLVVLNGREGGEDIDVEYWLKHIESFGGDSPVIVVQNKISQHPFELNYRGLQARYPQIRGFVKTDCRDGIGLEKLRKQIRSTIGHMPEVRMKFPVDWFTIKEQLESMKAEYIDYQQFIELCAREGVSAELDRDALGFVLHCLGIALTYRDDSRLRETSVLKPEWVTKGIYKILNAEQVAERQGELQLKDLQQLLPKKRYPVGKHLFLMELMRKFSLCLPFQDAPDRYLVPELLGKEEPTEVAKFKPENCLSFEYHYGILPEGVLPRFIVRTHTLSRNQQRWRSGVILAYEDCKALVKADPAERRVVVRVRGGNANSRRNLLAIIRYDLDRIHSEFSDRLDVQAKVPIAQFPAFSVDYQKLVALERKKIPEFPEYIGNVIVTVRVRDLLNGVDLEEQRGDPVETIDRAQPVFFSYSHKDEALRDELETHLKLLQRQRIISTWHDRKILPGAEWDGQIDVRLEDASIILLLISSDFIASDYCWDKEVARAMKRHDAKEAVVIPISLRACDWKGAPFQRLQSLPADAKPVTAWPDRDAAWTDVAKGLRKIAEGLPPVAPF